MIINPFETNYLSQVIILDQFGKRINSNEHMPLVEVGYESEEARVIQYTKEDATLRDIDYLKKTIGLVDLEAEQEIDIPQYA